MYKKNILLVFALVFVIGLFFQYNRTDGFVRLIKNTNENLLAFSDSFAARGSMENARRERFLILYNPIDLQSTFLRKKVEDMLLAQKKTAVSVADVTGIDWGEPYDGIILATGQLDRIAEFSGIWRYLTEGGRVAFMVRFDPGAQLDAIMPDLGIESAASEVQLVTGVKMKSSFLFGGKGFELDGTAYNTEVLPVVLNDQATLHLTSYDDTPLLWETQVGKGRALVYNGSRISEKINRGLIAGMLSRLKPIYLYPIIGAKVFFIDDFPAPEPEGNYEKIYNEFHLTTSQFYREVWWPEMLAFAERYGIKFTGLIIESYKDQVRPPFAPEAGRRAKDNLVIYGRELLKSGGELGIHGYNHQPLALSGYAPEKLGYTAWPSQDEMVASLLELKRYIKDVYPDYEIRVYVPPSNVMSPMGKQALLRAFPNLKIFSSLYSGTLEDRAYYQEFGKNPDGTFEIPRVASGFIISKNMTWESLNVLNATGVFSHFVHPDELFYEESKDLTWRQMREGYGNMLKMLDEKYPWLRSCTASQTAEYLDEYLSFDYWLEWQEEDTLKIHTRGIRQEVLFILKTEKKIQKAIGCTVRETDDQTYLIGVSGDEASLVFEGGAAL